LPRGRDREIVHDARDREYRLRGSESRTLATVGAFRGGSARDLRDHADRPADPRDGDLRHLREQGLIETVRIPGYREQAVVLTDRARSLLEASRDRDRDTGIWSIAIASASGNSGSRTITSKPLATAPIYATGSMIDQAIFAIRQICK